jgi:hypothetical protein
MNARDIAAAQIQNAYETLGDPIYYNGSTESILAIVSYGKGSEYKGSDISAVRATIRVQVSDVSEVEDNHTILIGAVSWGVVAGDYSLSSSGLEWIININKVD